MTEHSSSLPSDDPLLRDVPEEEGFKVLNHRYVIYDTIGQGGMGIVFKGYHLKLEVDVAIKCLYPGLERRNPDSVTRFQTEARAAARIHHENVVQVMDAAEDGGLHYLVMEFIQGEDARRRMARKGHLTVDEAAQIALGAARGLTAAHGTGLVHRDIKPDNVLIGADGSVKLADLGLAKTEEGQTGLTASGAAMGTPLYMPPEQFGDAKNVGPASDIYGLGATLYFLLTGRDGISAGSFSAVYEAVLNRPFPDPRELRPEVPAGLAELVLRCTRKEARERPQQAEEVVEALESHLEGVDPMLRDSKAGTTKARPVVSPPPAETLARIRVSLTDAGLEASPLPAPTPTTDAPATSGERPRTLLLWAVLVLLVGLASALMIMRPWSSGSREPDPRTSQEPGAAVRNRAPEGAVVIQREPALDECTQPPGPGAAAGWAWKIENSATGIVFLLVEPGRFWMGYPEGDSAPSEPGHWVDITQPFYLSQTEVTQDQWWKVRKSTPSTFSGGIRPVESVSWTDVTAFCQEAGFRLPTEAEWEYACRAGTTSYHWSGDAPSEEIMWFRVNGGNITHATGTRIANPWGFHDMHGNVGEFCADWFGPYSAESQVDPTGPSEGTGRVYRGGSYLDDGSFTHASRRVGVKDFYANAILGFRVAISP